MEPQTEPRPPPCVEILGPDGRIRRFAAGTKAGFAVDRLNSRLCETSEHILCIEAVKEGEESVEFGPDAELVKFGDDWILRTVQAESDLHFNSDILLPKPNMSTSGNQQRSSANLKHDLSNLYPGGKLPRGGKPEFTVEYIGKVALCFVFMLVLGGLLKAFLEQLPSFQSSQGFASNDVQDL